jgi:hypothetical protein
MNTHITESIGHLSAYSTLEEALAQFSHGSTQMVAISEPSSVTIRRHSLDTGKSYLYQAKQAYVNVRYSPRGRWNKCQLLTFDMERYGTAEQ